MSEQPSEQEAASQQAAASGATTPEGSSGAAASDAAPSEAATAASAVTGASAASTPVVAESEAPSAAAAAAESEAPSAAQQGAGISAALGSAPAASVPSAAAQSGAASSAKSTSAKSHKSETTHRSHHGESSRSPSPSGRDETKERERKKEGAGTSRRKRMRLGELDLSQAKIGFLGAGKMAESTVNGLIHYAKISPSRIHVAAPSSRGLERFKALGCRVTKRNYDIFGRYDCDIVFLCFHGYVVKHCYKLGGARPHPITTNYIPHQRHPIYILSLVSGISLSQIRACLLNPESANRYVIEMHRVMMNTAVGHGLGICAVDCEPDSKKLSAPLRQLLSSIAQLEMVPAAQMDAACAAGGSGLAFAYYFINALADGATKMGLSRVQAIRFASKTAQCAAQTMLESGKHPAELRDQVSSPSGAAIYGLHVLDKNDVASGVSAAVEAAHKRLSDLATQDVERH